MDIGIILAAGKGTRLKSAEIAMITCTYVDPDGLAWGRVIRGSDGNIVDIVEQKNASENQRQIKELNTVGSLNF